MLGRSLAFLAAGVGLVWVEYRLGLLDWTKRVDADGGDDLDHETVLTFVGLVHAGAALLVSRRRWSLAARLAAVAVLASGALWMVLEFRAGWFDALLEATRTSRSAFGAIVLLAMALAVNCLPGFVAAVAARAVLRRRQGASSRRRAG